MKEEESPILTPILKDEVECDINKNNETTAALWFLFLFFVGLFLFWFIYLEVTTDSRSVLTFQLVCKTSDPNQIQQHLSNISARYNRYDYKDLSSATAQYLLGVPDQYFSALTSFRNGRRPSKEWDAYYESLVVQTTEQFLFMNRMSNNTTLEDMVKYVVVELVIAIDSTYELPTIKTFRNVIEALRFIISVSSRYFPTFKAVDLFWTHPLNDIKDVPSLNIIHLPQLE